MVTSENSKPPAPMFGDGRASGSEYIHNPHKKGGKGLL